MAKGPSRKVFDSQITQAHYRWEFLRRNAKYRRTVDRWLKWGYKVTKSNVIDSPFGLQKRRKYRADCARWGLHLLIPYTVTHSEEAMAIFPVFADTPARQRVVKDPKALRKRVDVGRPPTSERDLRRYFKTEKVQEGPWQLKPLRKHFQKFDFYLQVFDLVHPSPFGEAMSFREASRRLGRSISTLRSAYAAACWMIGATARDSKLLIELEHDCSTCPTCSKAKTADQMCKMFQNHLPQVPRYSRELLQTPDQLDRHAASTGYKHHKPPVNRA